MKFLNEIFFCLFAAVIFYLAFRDGGWPFMREGLAASWGMAMKFMPLFIIAFLVFGQAQVLTEKHLATITQWISGGTGVFAALFGGILVPSIVVFYPIFHTMWQQGVGRIPILLSIISFSLLNWQIYMYRIPLLGWPLTIASFFLSFIIFWVAFGILLLLEKIIHRL